MTTKLLGALREYWRWKGPKHYLVPSAEGHCGIEHRRQAANAHGGDNGVEPLVRGEKLCAHGTLDCAAACPGDGTGRHPHCRTHRCSRQLVPRLGASAAGTLGQIDTVITLTISFLVFTFGSLLVAI